MASSRSSSRKREASIIISDSEPESELPSIFSSNSGNDGGRDSDDSWTASPQPKKKRARKSNKRTKVGSSSGAGPTIEPSTNNPGPSSASVSTVISLTIPTFPALGARAQKRKRKSGGKAKVAKPKVPKASKVQDKEKKVKVPAQPKPKLEVGAKKGESAKGVCLSDALECIICLDFPVSPIHNCTNGHITCGTCVGKLTEKKCGLCKAKLQRSILGERLAKQYEVQLKCDNSESGCKAMINSTEMKAHLKSCNFRDVVCNQSNGEPCSGVKVGLREYVAHLSAKHGIFPKTESGKLGISVDLAKIFPKDSVARGISFPLISIQRKGRVFLAHSHRTKDLFFYWVTLLGEKADADKFLYELKLNPIGKNKKLGLSYKLPILPYHECPEYKKVGGNLAVIPISGLSDLGFGIEVFNEGVNSENVITTTQFFTLIASLDIVSRS